MSNLAKVFTEIVETVAKEKLVSAAVVATIAVWWGGYGKEYRDAIKEEREYRTTVNA